MPGTDIVATAPDLWETFVDICMGLGIDMTQLPTLRTPNEIIEFCHTSLNIQIQPLYKEVTTLAQDGWTWVMNTPVDASTSNEMVVRGVTDLVVVDGAATSITQGKGIFGTITRKAAALAGVLALGVSLTASQIGEHISRFVEGWTPYTVDGEDAVPVLIDENGTTYLDSRAIQHFREILVELGVFDNSQEFPVYPAHEEVTITSIQSLSSLFDYAMGYTPYTFVFADPVHEQILYNFVDLYSDYPATITIANTVTNWGGWSPLTITVWDLESGDSFENGTNQHKLATFSCYGNDSSTGTMRVTNVNVSQGGGQNVLTTGINVSSSTTDMCNINSTPAGGVSGLTPTNPDVGDLTQTLNDIYPDWTDDAFTLPSPTENDLNNKADWLPVSITDTNPFENDHVATSDDHLGETNEGTQNQILEKLQELLQTIAQYQAKTDDEVVTPTIPVGDSGDTPPATPTVISGASNGLWTIYNPTLSEVQQFGGWLWSSSLIDQIMRQFNSPIDAVIGFMSIYCTPITGDRKVIKAGYLDSPVSAKEVTNQYVTINCGQVEVPEYYHTAVDYTRSKVEIFLPFIGIVPLDCSVVTGSTLEVIYRIDVLTGTCLAQIKVIKQNSDAVMYTYPGNCAVQLPMTASTYTGAIGAIMGAISGGFALGMGDVAGGIKNLGQGLVSGISNLSGTAKSGNLASNAGALGIRIPYLIITHPTVYDAMIYNQFYGYPSNVYQRLSAMSGFVRVKDIHLDSVSCTEQERDMIYARLKEGVIIS